MAALHPVLVMAGIILVSVATGVAVGIVAVRVMASKITQAMAMAMLTEGVQKEKQDITPVGMETGWATGEGITGFGEPEGAVGYSDKTGDGSGEAEGFGNGEGRGTCG